MSSELTTVETVPPDSVAAASTDDLKNRLATAITVTVRGLYETALIFDELRRRGEPVDELRLALGPYLPRIARGELAAEAVIALAGFKTALDRLALLPPADQKTALNRQFPVVVAVEGALPTVAMRRIADLSAREVRMLISDDGNIRDAAAQGDIMRAERKKTNSTRTSIPRGRQPSVSVSGDHVVIGRQAVKRTHLLESLRGLGVIS